MKLTFRVPEHQWKSQSARYYSSIIIEVPKHPDFERFSVSYMVLQPDSLESSSFEFDEDIP